MARVPTRKIIPTTLIARLDNENAFKEPYFDENFLTRHRLGRAIGEGSFAKVRHLEDIRKPAVGTPGKIFAVKIMSVRKMKSDDISSLHNEISIMFALNHEHILKPHSIFWDNSHFYLKLELCIGGELFDRIVKKESYSESEATNCMLQIVSALHYCHTRTPRVVHRDIKPENLLYASKEPDETLKLADFGLAGLLNADECLNGSCGTPGYAAPEVLLSNSYTTQVDLWSCGVVLYILLCGFPPFFDGNTDDLNRKIIDVEYQFGSPEWDDISDEAKDLVSGLLVFNPEDRLDTCGVLNHPWIKTSSCEKQVRELTLAQTNLKAYNARRKLKAGVHKIRIVNLFRQGSKSLFSPRSKKKKARKKKDHLYQRPKIEPMIESVGTNANVEEEIVPMTSHDGVVIGEIVPMTSHMLTVSKPMIEPVDTNANLEEEIVPMTSHGGDRVDIVSEDEKRCTRRSVSPLMDSDFHDKLLSSTEFSNLSLFDPTSHEEETSSGS